VKQFKLLLLAALLLSLSGCEEKPTEHTKVSSKAPKEKSTTTDSKKTKEKESKSREENSTEENTTIEPKYTFLLHDINDTNRSFTIENKHIEISNVSESIILLNFFTTWCPPCKGQIPYLVDLQKKYKGKMFVAGILINDDPKKEALETFYNEYHINYFVAVGSQNDEVAKLAIKKLKLPKDLPIPVTILFRDGHYYSHYEGAVPIEMLEHDIKNVLQKD
jgi:thiol-disulfide isomerase/thioredoxin